MVRCHKRRVYTETLYLFCEVIADLLETVIAASLGNGGCSLSEVGLRKQMKEPTAKIFEIGMRSGCLDWTEFERKS